jgi:catechol 2,3-dioxygenase-like lactoylglutathione lyase family enzyme
MDQQSSHGKKVPIISGIQQVGIGVADAKAAWKWYRKYFGMDVPIFEDAAQAKLMTKYTAGKVEERYAILAMNMQGGGGFEIWQYTSKSPLAPKDLPKLGDLGIFCVKIRTRNIEKTYQYFKSENLVILGDIKKSPDGRDHFFVRDPYGNLFQMVESESWFLENDGYTGGVAGCIIGVTNLKRASALYGDLLEYTEQFQTQPKQQDDLKALPGGEGDFARKLLLSSPFRYGAFSELLCQTEIELIQRLDIFPSKIFQDRYWGDLGFIHICFDIRGMKALEIKAKALGFQFTVNSADSFDMGKAAGQFAYCEDPDGTLIEFVETHKIPIFEKLGLFLNLRNRNPHKALPKWMLRMLSLNRKKDKA